MSFQKHCPGCFHDKGGIAVCPICGYDEAAPRSPLFLPHGIIIGGHFRVGRVLGQPGGFGITYLGWDVHLQQRVAIKEFLPREIVTRQTGGLLVNTHTDDGRAAFEYGKEQFLREARIVAKLDHPNVVRVRSFFNANGTAYLVMDYYEGMSLGDYLATIRNIIEPPLAVPLIRPVLEALEYVHEHDLIHRDLKPHNIYLATVGKPIVLDFGAARQAAGERVQSMSVVLTDGYAPLEQYQRRAAQGPWTDVYGAAATLYRMMNGAAPPTALDRLGDDPLEKGGWDKIPQSLRPALRKALALKPEDRFRSASEFIAALSDYKPFQPAPVAPAEPAPPPSAEVSQGRSPPAAPASSVTVGGHAPVPVQAQPLTSTPSEVPPAAVSAGVGEDVEHEEHEFPQEEAPPTRRSLPALPPTQPGDLDRKREATVEPTLPTRPPAVSVDYEKSVSQWILFGVPTLLFLIIAALVLVAWSGNRAQPEPVWNKPVETKASVAAVEVPAPEKTQLALLESPLQPDWVRLEGGDFMMGEDEPGSQASPAHRVSVRDFTIARTEVTVEQFSQFVRLTGYQNPSWRNYPCESSGSRNPTWEDPGFAQSSRRPVVCVSWVDARAYASWLSGRIGRPVRLPTEAEWEYAARAGSKSLFWWGNRFDETYATCGSCPDARRGPAPVASWPANPFGLFDTASNVREWTCSAAAAFGEGSELRCAAEDAPGERAVRGGSWTDGPNALRSAERAFLEGNRRDVHTGFRIVSDAGSGVP